MTLLRRDLEQLEVQFLHGVPVYLPKESIDAILTRFKEALPKEMHKDFPSAVGFNLCLRMVIDIIDGAGEPGDILKIIEEEK